MGLREETGSLANERGSELERERMVSSHWEKGGAKQNRTEKNGE